MTKSTKYGIIDVHGVEASTMAKIDNLNTVSGGYLSVPQINENFNIVADAFDNTLSRDGSTPNTMQSDLDMNGFAILNAIINVDDYSIFSGTLGSMSSQNASSVAITGGTMSGVTLSTVTFSSTQSFTNLALAGSLLDTNSNELLKFGTTASAVNEFTVTNAATGNSPLFSATGNDTNIDLSFQAKGTGAYVFKATSTQATLLKLFEDTDNGTNFVGIKAPDSISSNVTFTLPSADGSSGQFLKTDGAGTLSFASVATPIISVAYTSSDQAITYGTAVTLAHSLGADPKIVQLSLICQTGEAGYVAGDKIIVAPERGANAGSAPNVGLAVYYDSTNIYYRFSSDGFTYTNKSATTVTTLTAANWKVRVKAYA